MRAAGPERSNSVPGPAQATDCAPPGAVTASGETQPFKASAAVAEALLPVPEDVVGPTPRSKMLISIARRAQDVDEFDVGLMREIPMHADLGADLPPGPAVDGKLRIVDHDDEVGIAGVDLDARNREAVGQLNRALGERGNAHRGGHFNRVAVAGFNAADAQAGIGFNLKIVAGLGV